MNTHINVCDIVNWNRMLSDRIYLVISNRKQDSNWFKKWGNTWFHVLISLGGRSVSSMVASVAQWQHKAVRFLHFPPLTSTILASLKSWVPLWLSDGFQKWLWNILPYLCFTEKKVTGLCIPEALSRTVLVSFWPLVAFLCPLLQNPWKRMETLSSPLQKLRWHQVPWRPVTPQVSDEQQIKMGRYGLVDTGVAGGGRRG